MNEEDGIVYENYTGGGISSTIDASYYKGTGSRNGKEREFLAICIGNGQTNQAWGGVYRSLELHA